MGDSAVAATCGASVASVLLAEDLLLLLTDDDSGRLVVPGMQVDLALGGALLAELVLRGHADVMPKRGLFGSDQVVVTCADPTGDTVLDKALTRLAATDSRRASTAVHLLGRKMRRRLYARLVDLGVLRAHRGKVLGVFPRQEWPAEDAGREEEVRGRLEQALAHGQVTDERTAALVSLLHALRATHKVVSPARLGTSRRELAESAKRIADGDACSAAVRRALDGVNAAMVAMAGAVAAGGAG